MSETYDELEPLAHEEPMAMDPEEYNRMVRERAFELYVARCAEGVEGTPDEDWARAESDLGDPVETVGAIVAPSSAYI